MRIRPAAPDDLEAVAGTADLLIVPNLTREAGCYKLQLLSARHREGAHGLYASAGFEPRAEGLRKYL